MVSFVPVLKIMYYSFPIVQSVHVHIGHFSTLLTYVQYGHMDKAFGIKFSERLRSSRKARGLTQQAAADAFGISLRGYCRWEAGEREPSLNVFAKIAKTFNVSADYLLGLTDEDPFGE